MNTSYSPTPSVGAAGLTNSAAPVVTRVDNLQAVASAPDAMTPTESATVPKAVADALTPDKAGVVSPAAPAPWEISMVRDVIREYRDVHSTLYGDMGEPLLSAIERLCDYAESIR